ncbi:MAG TPA: M12 family metallo-peptidase, partial [Flavobacteriales bacterium]|nr:M12 family metallo-peptidase [Flavobacteriales bacterium]
MHASRFLLLLVIAALNLPAFSRSGQVSERIEALRQRGVVFAPVKVFQGTGNAQDQAGLWSKALEKADVVTLDRVSAVRAMRAAAEHVALELPFEGRTVILDLARAEVGPEDVRVVAASGAVSVGLPGVHYRGMIRGIPGSWAAISIYADEVMGLLNDGQDQIVVGRFERDVKGAHVIYRDRHLRGTPDFTCATEDREGIYDRHELEITGGDRTIRCVRYYWEVNHNVFLDKGDIANTTNYVTGLFNQSALLFDNDGIDVTLSELFIWDVPSPYTGPGSGAFLDQFGVTRTSFNGDMAHLISYGGGGGVAWLNTLCNSQTRLRMAFSGINSTYANVPTYSWSTMVVTHEAGHNLGSRHTHACSWNGNGTNIDGCGP